MAITSRQNFENNFIIKAGEFASPVVLNRAVLQLKTEIDALISQGISTGTLTSSSNSGLSLSSFGVKATADEINVLSGFAGDNDDMTNLSNYSDKLQYLDGLDDTIINKLNLIEGGGSTITWTTLGLTEGYGEEQIDWLCSLYSEANTNITSDEINNLFGLTSNVQQKFEYYDQQITTLTNQTSVNSLSDLGITVSNTRINWLGTIYNSSIDSSELGQLDGCVTNIQQKFDNFDSTIAEINSTLVDLTTNNDYTVTSINGQTGNVTITAASLGAAQSLIGLSDVSDNDVQDGSLYNIERSSNFTGESVLRISQTGTLNNASAIKAFTNSTNASAIVSGTKSLESGAIVGYHNPTEEVLDGNYGYARIGLATQSIWANMPIRATAFNTFTGQHSVLVDSEDAISGDILSVKESNVLSTDDSLVVVGDSTEKSKSVYGVLTDFIYKDVKSLLLDYPQLMTATMKSRNLNSKGKEFLRLYKTYKPKMVNALGEGAINVCELNGSIENGDYITSSGFKNKGMKQDDDILRSSTVAKAMENVNWENEEIGVNGCFEVDGVKCKKISCTYHCG